MGMFSNRNVELRRLGEIFDSKNAELVILYGRRRVGKSRLLVEAIKGKNALYLLADTSKSILDGLARQVDGDFVRFSGWDDFFQYLCDSRYDIIVIDEFQYLCNVEKSWPTMLQRWWEKIRLKPKKIVLSGSIISTIYKITRGYGSALYGRQTVEMRIEPLSFANLRDFFADYSMEELVEVYSILGGIPRYLEEFDRSKSVGHNIQAKILEKTSFLYNEPMNLLFEEFRDVSPYASIIQAITQGKNRFNEISDYSRIESHKLPKYLTVLERVDLVEKEIPVDEKKTRSKKTRYRIKDNFYRFWFTFVFGNKQMIERGLSRELFKSLQGEINAYYGRCFEDVCREYLLEEQAFTRVGRWWHKDVEIDLVALNEAAKEVIFAECKWKRNVNGLEVAKNLSQKTPYFGWNKKQRKETLLVFAKSFTKKITEFEGKKVRCMDLKDLEAQYHTLSPAQPHQTSTRR